jgi:hypothetical protein
LEVVLGKANIKYGQVGVEVKVVPAISLSLIIQWFQLFGQGVAIVLA